MNPAAAWFRSLLSRSQRQDGESDHQFRIYVNPVGLTPWMWKGIRGEVYAVFIGLLIVLGGMLHWYYAAAIVSPLWLMFGAWLSRRHPFWPEILVRLVVQPIGFLDS